ncbi:MAG: YerC/YecD family TrpR-related protein [Steroidobacteraceae bacterium]
MKRHSNVTQRQEALAERHLCEAVASLETPEECRAFFRDLCSPAELQAMADRWAVVEWLRRGRPYREVHRATGVSITTIARVARFLANGNGGYALAASRLPPAERANGTRGIGTRGNGRRAAGASHV